MQKSALHAYTMTTKQKADLDYVFSGMKKRESEEDPIDMSKEESDYQDYVQMQTS